MRGDYAQGSFKFHLEYMSGFMKTVLRDRSFGAGGKLGGPRKKNHNKEGGLPKLFCLMRGGLEKNKLVSSEKIIFLWPS